MASPKFAPEHKTSCGGTEDGRTVARARYP